ncbi:arabinose efflux permease family protein [Ralstonia pickettii OR214]|jgi:predicted MFS family arabinose efflux permease|uniref:Arabinose efflux permease family protein n=1 Tax=Ralstonia pickettii OR214 TaxID=1264675 RepID=R0DY75_RALPI|nr:arabinose efflux permease family protein [Ralstonia pickettii OR214]
MLAFCAAASISKVYFAQPLLGALARDFALSDAWVGGIIGATQVGCALALALVVPLGDRWPCKRVLLVRFVLLTPALLAVGLVQAHWSLLLGMLSIGLLGTAMTQGLIACAAVLAPSPERGRVVGAVQGGVVIGLLLAHALTGWIAEVAGWRAVYATSVGFSVAMLCMLWRALPTPPTVLSPPKYIALLRSMWQLLMAEPVLQGRGLIGLLMFAAFNVFWGAMALALSAPPYEFSPAGIGSFGLVGVIGALAAARAGHQADRRWAQAATGVALDLLLVAWLPLGLGAQHLAGLIVGVVLLDLGGQAVHVPQSEADFSLAAGGAQPAVWRVHAVLCGGQWIGGGAFDAGVCVGRMIKDMSSGEQPSAWRC